MTVEQAWLIWHFGLHTMIFKESLHQVLSQSRDFNRLAKITPTAINPYMNIPLQCIAECIRSLKGAPRPQEHCGFTPKMKHLIVIIQ